MAPEISFLIFTAIIISCMHTLTGPDHYVPFIALSKANNWSVSQTIFWTVICGLGHIGSSVAIGFLGITVGWSLAKINVIEGARGGIAGWAMLVSGMAYFLFAVFQLNRKKLHKHFEILEGDKLYVYEHQEGTYVRPQQKQRVNTWVMFIVFVLGPCEPLIPLLSFPAAQHSVDAIILVISVFTLFTLIVMVTMVLIGYYGISLLKSSLFEKYIGVLSAITIMICGTGMLFLNW